MNFQFDLQIFKMALERLLKLYVAHLRSLWPLMKTITVISSKVSYKRADTSFTMKCREIAQVQNFFT